MPLHAAEGLLDTRGPIVKFAAPSGRETAAVSGYELFDQLCDETRDYKAVREALVQLGSEEAQGPFLPGRRTRIGSKVHRILMPVFGPLAIEVFNVRKSYLCF